MIGLCGANGTGKTTLANAYALRTGVPFVQTSATPVFERLGCDARIDYPFDKRLEIQREVLAEFTAIWRAAAENGAFISDRTPLDLLTYLMIDVRRETLTPELEVAFEAYRKSCFAITNQLFSTLVVVQPGVPQNDRGAGKGPASSGFIEHYNAVIVGLTCSEEMTCNHYYIPRTMTDLIKRVDSVQWAIKRSMEKHRLMVSGLESLVLH